MDEIKLVRDWVLSFPLWGQESLSVDSTAAAPGNCGLFPVGVEELDRRQDVLGNCRCRYRRQFLLRRVAENTEDAPRWLMAFERWVHTHTPPALGSQCTAYAQKGRLLSADAGTAIYEIKISIEYTEEMNHG